MVKDYNIPKTSTTFRCTNPTIGIPHITEILPQGGCGKVAKMAVPQLSSMDLHRVNVTPNLTQKLHLLQCPFLKEICSIRTL